MAPRTNWKGFLKISLVSGAIALFPATSTRERIRFNIINRETGNRVRYRQIGAETGADVPEGDRVKGYKVADGCHVLLEPRDLDEVALESTHTIEIESFVPRKEIDEVHLGDPYYLVPDEELVVEAFSVIRDAMRATSLAGLAHVVLYNHERLLMLEPLGKGIKAAALRSHEDVHDEKGYFSEMDDLRVPKDTLELAEHIVKTKRAHFDPKKFSDRYEDALTALIQAKQAGKPVPTSPARPSNVINLVEALRRSARSERGSGGGGEVSSRRGGKSRAQRLTAALQKKRAAENKRFKRAS
jgi:DNA end-binding protein Ku